MIPPLLTAADALAAIAAFPIRPFPSVAAAAPFLVLAPHPDDESLGCGGLLALCARHGTPVHVAILTDGAGSHPNSRLYPAPRLAALREQEARAAIAALGLQPHQLSFLGLPDTASPMHGPAFDAALATLARIPARTVLAPWQHDPHCDHLSAHRLATALARQHRLAHWSYPVWGLTLPPETPLPGPVPTGFRLDVAAHLDAKRAAIAAHRSQYAALIPDDPGGFQLPKDFLARFDHPTEPYLELHAARDDPPQ